MQITGLVPVAVALAVGLGAGFGGGFLARGSDTALQDELETLEARLAAESRRADAAEQIADEYLADAADLREREVELDRLEAKLRAQERRQKQSSFGDGIWQVGTDFRAGIYRAPGGGGCYWAMLGSADTSDIINNGGFAANQTLDIDSPWFETNGCGVWEKVG